MNGNFNFDNQAMINSQPRSMMMPNNFDNMQGGQLNGQYNGITQDMINNQR